MALQPDDFGSLLRALDQRLRAIETQGVLNNSAIKNGTLTVLDGSGNVMGRIGKLADGSFGIQWFDGGGQTLFRVDSVNGQVAPTSVFTPIMFAGALLSGQVTSPRPGTVNAFYSLLWVGRFFATGSVVNYSLFIAPNAMTMDWRWMIREDPGGALTQVASATGVVANGTAAGTFTIPAACLVSGTDPRGRNFYYELQAQRTAGTTATVDIGFNTQPYLTG